MQGTQKDRRPVDCDDRLNTADHRISSIKSVLDTQVDDSKSIVTHCSTLVQVLDANPATPPSSRKLPAIRLRSRRDRDKPAATNGPGDADKTTGLNTSVSLARKIPPPTRVRRHGDRSTVVNGSNRHVNQTKGKAVASQGRLSVLPVRSEPEGGIRSITAIPGSRLSILDGDVDQNQTLLSAQEQVRRYFEVSAPNPTPLIDPGHTASDSTRIPNKIDMHLADNLTLKHVRYSPNIVRDLLKRASDTLNASENLPPVDEHFPGRRLAKSAGKPLRGLISDESDIARLYESVFGCYCPAIAATLALKESSWGREHAPLRWALKESNSVNQAVADGFLRVNTQHPLLRSSEVLKVIDRWFAELAVWEFKNVLAGRYEVLQEIMEFANSRDLFPWESCPMDVDTCRCQHGPDEFVGSRCINGARMGYDVEPALQVCDLTTNCWDSESYTNLKTEGSKWMDDVTKFIKKEVDLSDNKNTLQRHAKHMVQQAWMEAVKHDCTFLVISTGRHELIGIRQRATQTLYISDVIVPWQFHAYSQLQIGLCLAILWDAELRAKMLDVRWADLNTEIGSHVALMLQDQQAISHLSSWNIAYSNTACTTEVEVDNDTPLQAQKVLIRNDKFEKISRSKKEGKQKYSERLDLLWKIACSSTRLKFESKNNFAAFVRHMPPGPYLREVTTEPVTDPSVTELLRLRATSYACDNNHSVIRGELYVGPDENAIIVVAKIGNGDISRLRKELKVYEDLHKGKISCIPNFVGLFVMEVGGREFAVLVLEDVGVRVMIDQQRIASTRKRVARKGFLNRASQPKRHAVLRVERELRRCFKQALRKFHKTGYVHHGLSLNKLLVKRDHNRTRHTIVGLADSELEPESIIERVREYQDLRVMLGPSSKHASTATIDARHGFRCYIGPVSIVPGATAEEMYNQALQELELKEIQRGKLPVPINYHYIRDQDKCWVVPYFESDIQCKSVERLFTAMKSFRAVLEEDMKVDCLASGIEVEIDMDYSQKSDE